ncbi:unnamed protein product, partial [Rotaria sp. Silwood1]
MDVNSIQPGELI